MSPCRSIKLCLIPETNPIYTLSTQSWIFLLNAGRLRVSRSLLCPLGRCMYKSHILCHPKRLKSSNLWRIGLIRTSWFIWSQLRNVGNHKIFCPILPLMDLKNKSGNSGRGQRSFQTITLLFWLETWSQKKLFQLIKQCWIPWMEFVMKQVLAFHHGQFGQGHGLLKRIGMVTFLTSISISLGEWTWGK